MDPFEHLESRRNRLRKKMTATLFVGLAACALVQGCSSGSSNSDMPPLDYPKVAATLASAFCGVLQGCCDAAQHPYNEAACIAHLESNQRWVYSYERSSLNRYRDKVYYDASGLQKCVEAIRARESRCSNADTPLDDIWIDHESIKLACSNVIKGIFADGEPCQHDFECAKPAQEGGASCLPRGADGLCWQYIQPTKGKAGDLCSLDLGEEGERAGCDDGMYCEGAEGAAAGRCRPFKAVDESCRVGQITWECGGLHEPYYCDSVTGKCKALPREGEACVKSHRDCAETFYCDSGLGSNPTCRAERAVGSDCGASSQCKTGLCARDPNSEPETQAHCSAGYAVAYVVSGRTCGSGPLIDFL